MRTLGQWRCYLLECWGSAVRRVNSHYAAQWELVRTEAGIIFWITGELFAALLMLRRRGAVADNGVVICDG